MAQWLGGWLAHWLAGGLAPEEDTKSWFLAGWLASWLYYCRITRIPSSILLTRTDMDLGMCTGDRNMKYSVFVQRGGMSPPALGAEEEDIQHKAVPSRPLRSIYSSHPGGTVVDLFDSAPLRPDSSCLTLTPCGGT